MFHPLRSQMRILFCNRRIQKVTRATILQLYIIKTCLEVLQKQ